MRRRPAPHTSVPGRAPRRMPVQQARSATAQRAARVPVQRPGFADEPDGAGTFRMRSTNTVADGGRAGCYLVGRWLSSKPRDARLKTLASSRC
jgi:hypothetical protein